MLARKHMTCLLVYGTLHSRSRPASTLRSPIMSSDNKASLPDPSEGGKARAKKLSKAEREEIARRAADARWNIPQATHDGTLSIAGREIECAVLEDGRRVLGQQSFMAAIGRTGKPSRAEQVAGNGSSLITPVFLAAENLIPFIGEDLRSP